MVGKIATIIGFSFVFISSYTNHFVPHRPIKASCLPYEQHDLYIHSVRLRYVDEGTGPALILIHGHQSRIEEFAGLMPDLIPHFRVLAFDLPGSGYSGQPNIDYSLEIYEQVIVEFLMARGVQQAIIAGGSLGGNLALRVARDYPKHISKVVAWSPASCWTKHEVLAFGAVLLSDTPFYKDMLMVQSSYWFSPNFKNASELIAGHWKYLNEVDSPIFRKCFGQIAAQQLAESNIGMGNKIQQPTLILAGELDEGLELAHYAEIFAKELPHGKFVMVKGVGHSIQSEAKDELVKQMKEFLKW